MPTSDTNALFRPFTLKKLELKNRIVMAPMTRTSDDSNVRPQPSAMKRVMEAFK